MNKVLVLIAALTIQAGCDVDTPEVVSRGGYTVHSEIICQTRNQYQNMERLDATKFGMLSNSFSGAPFWADNRVQNKVTIYAVLLNEPRFEGCLSAVSFEGVSYENMSISPIERDYADFSPTEILALEAFTADCDQLGPRAERLYGAESTGYTNEGYLVSGGGFIGCSARTANHSYDWAVRIDDRKDIFSRIGTQLFINGVKA